MIKLIIRLLKNKKGDTNIISLLIILAVIIAAVVIFKPYIAKFFLWLTGLFG